MRRRVVFPLFPFLALFAVLPSRAADATTQRIAIAVNELRAQNVDPGVAPLITDRLRSELVNTGSFAVLERDQMQEILKEQGFQQSGACNDEACAVQIGQILGVSHMVAGSIGQVGKVLTLSVRLIDVTTGRILHTVNTDCKCAVDEVLRTSCREVAQQLDAKMSGKPIAAGAATKKKGRAARRITFGALSACFAAAGVFADSQVRRKTDANRTIKNAYAAEPTNGLYEGHRADYQSNWEAARTWSTVRNVLYGAGGACAVGFVISIPF